VHNSRRRVGFQASSLVYAIWTYSAQSFDVDWPMECDDEYWGTGSLSPPFNQPADKPSKLTFFILMLKLQQIHAFALRTLVSFVSHLHEMIINFQKYSFGQRHLARRWD
jgi:hypothetical protein